jgi:hypothetical protein
MLRKLLLAITVLLIAFEMIPAQKTPVLKELREVSPLPAEVVQRASALAWDGNKLWVPLYLDRGRYVTYDPSRSFWDTSVKPELSRSIAKVSGKWASPGGMVFVDGRMWTGSFYGESIGWVDMADPKTFKRIESRYKPDYSGSQSYSDIAYDGEFLWAAWKSFNHKMDRSKASLLLKINKNSGEVISEAPIPFGLTADGARGLTWDGTQLWYGCENELRSLQKDGSVTALFKLQGIQRISGLAYDGAALWIIEFEGKLWRLPLTEPISTSPF